MRFGVKFVELNFTGESNVKSLTIFQKLWATGLKKYASNTSIVHVSDIIFDEKTKSVITLQKPISICTVNNICGMLMKESKFIFKNINFDIDKMQVKITVLVR